MQLHSTDIDDLVIVEPKVFTDSRGYFFESFNLSAFQAVGLDYLFVQDNESRSSYGTLRGLHFQKGETAQAKLVRAIEGEILDVAVDIRQNSATYGKHFSTILSGENKRMLMIPRGFAHGFVVLSEFAVFAYKCDNFYSPTTEGGIHYADPDLAIDWRVPADKIQLSEKDRKNPPFRSL